VRTVVACPESRAPTFMKLPPYPDGLLG
jgi:hypothetical protein